MSLSLVVLAAGMGSRYGGLKQVEGFGPQGETLLEYSLYDAYKAGFDHVIFVIRRDIYSDFKERVLSRLPKFLSYECVFQELDMCVASAEFVNDRKKPRGTGHAVLAAKKVLSGPCAIINADDYYGVDGYRQMVKFLSNNCKEGMVSMVGYLLGNTLSENGAVNRGVCDVTDDLLYHVEEHIGIERKSPTLIADRTGKVLSPDTIVSMNFWGCDRSFFDTLEGERYRFLEGYDSTQQTEFYLPMVYDRLIKHSHHLCYVLKSVDEWCGVTYPDDKVLVQKRLRMLLQKGVYPVSLWEK